jgi:hypothetical protein
MRKFMRRVTSSKFHASFTLFMRQSVDSVQKIHLF